MALLCDELHCALSSNEATAEAVRSLSMTTAVVAAATTATAQATARFLYSIRHCLKSTITDQAYYTYYIKLLCNISSAFV
jgi:hypothetical protein